MNALVSLDSILEPVPGTLTPANLFGTGAIETVLAAIEKDVGSEVFTVETPEGRERIKSVAYKIARSKTTLDDIGKDKNAALKKETGAIDAERRMVRDRLDALKERVRGPLTAWEDAEAARVDGHERALVRIVEADRFVALPTAAMVGERIACVEEEYVRDWQEFIERAREAMIITMGKLEPMLAAAEQRERDAAELAELRRLKAEREEADQKAEADRIAAQQAAERKAYEERRERERAEKARQDQEAAVARAVERERQRAEQEKAAAIEAERRQQEAERVRVAEEKARAELAERKRQENKRHREKVQNEARAALAQCFPDLAPANVDRIIEAISTGLIRNVSITY